MKLLNVFAMYISKILFIIGCLILLRINSSYFQFWTFTIENNQPNWNKTSNLDVSSFSITKLNNSRATFHNYVMKIMGNVEPSSSYHPMTVVKSDGKRFDEMKKS